MNSAPPYHVHYRSSKNPERYLQMHESELILYGWAKLMLQRAGINPKTILNPVCFVIKDLYCSHKNAVEFGLKHDIL